jgi:SNF2 family DNA or RNA helicase
VTISRKHKALVVFPTPGVVSAFGNAPVTANGNRLIPHGLGETMVLRHLGFKIPNPMELYYDWCGGTPYNVQRATCRMMVENPRFFNLNHMGTGKTKTALWSWDYLNKQKLVGKMLVIAPLSTLSFVWAKEVFATLPGRTVQVLWGTRKQRLDRLKQDADIYVINHDGVKVIAPELYARNDINVLVLDELAVYRNQSERSKHMRKFAQRFTTIWGMTGAPMPNEPTDVWAQCQIIAPQRVPKFKSHARDMLMVNIGLYLWRPKPNAVETAFGWMQPSCRYSLDDVVELPPVISRTVEVPMSDEQRDTYKRVATAMAAMVKKKQITALNAGAAMSKLLQIAGGWVYTRRPEFVRLDPTPRIVAMADMIRSCDEKVLVAVPYRHMIEGISKILNMKGVDIEHCCVHGDTPKREQFFNLFQNTDKYKVMLVHPQCVSHGLTLTAASMVIWYLPIVSLETYDQLNARVTRIGQKHKQQILHLQASPVEKRIYKLLQEHQKMQNLFLELVEGATDDATN